MSLFLSFVLYCLIISTVLNEEFKQLKICFDASYLKAQLEIEGETGSIRFNLTMNSLEKVKNAVEKLFYVKKKSDIMIDDADCDKLIGFNKNQLNSSIINKKLDYDLYIFIRHSISDDKLDYYARPKIVKNDEVDGRPIAGYIIINRNFLVEAIMDDLYREELLNSILMHEFIHLLGFMEENGFANYKNKNDIFGTKEVERIDGLKIQKTIVKSEKILKFARLYFNCSTIDGIEFENLENEERIKNSHWEGRILLGDIMTSKINFQEQVISEFTLLLLEESGWYKINNYTGGLMRFGKSQGCHFFEKDCIEIEGSGQTSEAKALFPNDFCGSNSKSTCSAGRISRGYCDLNINLHKINYTTYIRNNYDKFKNLEGNKVYYGYGNYISEFCPKSVDLSKDYFTDEDTFYYLGNCKIGNNGFGKQIIFSDGFKGYTYSIFPENFGEEYGDNSFCALSSILHNNDTNELYKGLIRPTCYNMSCSEKSLTIKINNLEYSEYVVCPRSGNIIHIEGQLTNYTGYLFCPDYNLICTGTKLCNNMFDCVEKESQPKLSSFYNEYKKNITSEVIIDQEKDLSNIGNLKEYELSNDGICPINCRHCIDNHQCILCRDGYFYIGTAENDQNPIICISSRPVNSYYLTTSTKYVKDSTYFKCIDNCYLCIEAEKDKCQQCAPTHKINSTTEECEERIPKCILYNSTNNFTDNNNNGGALGYRECLNCNKSENYFCLNGDKTHCVLIEDYNNKTYYDMEDRDFSCVRKCSDRFFNNCIECNRTKCTKCSDDKEYIVNDYGLCIPKIENCLIQRLDVNYSECSQCKTDYYCIENKINECQMIDNLTYYYNISNNPTCIKRCNNTYSNCMSCNINHCNSCKSGYLLNNNFNCVKKLDNCMKQNLDIDDLQCLECDKDYYCIRGDTINCRKFDTRIDSIDFYYYYNYSHTSIQCIERCNNTFDNCVKCNKDRCIECKEGYFVISNGTCMKNITGCINNVFDGTKVECYECNMDKGYYCFNNSKSICHPIDAKDINDILKYYYFHQENDFSCYELCDKLLDNCLTCNDAICLECTPEYIVNHAGNFCYIRPFIPPDNDNCTLKMNESYINIQKVDPWNFTDYYFSNIPYIKIVNHYVGENYTVTVFVYSECTEELYDKGYFKLDTRELHDIMLKEAKPEPMDVIFSAYIVYNHKSYIGFFDVYSRTLNPYKVCHSCLSANYTVTNRLSDALNDTFGQAILALINSEKIDILNKESDIYNDMCKNVTLFGIDIPLKKRLHYLYLHKYLELILCNSENCTIEEYSYENSFVVCKCHIGNIFEDILEGEKIEYIPYEDDSKSTNDFIDSLQIIKCSINGFKLKNFKSNFGIYICLGFISIQIGLFIYYLIHSKPLVNLNKPIIFGNPPKRSILKMITDWDKNISYDKVDDENEIYVQPRDDADDQLLEETRSYVNLSGLSMITDVEGAIFTGNKVRDRADQKKSVLILLSNKGKNKSKNYGEDIQSDSDIIPQQQDENNINDNINYSKIYWHVLSLKQHIINFFSCINCCKITESYIPLSIRLTRSLFMVILSFILNILWINQTYYENKFEHFNKEYSIINSETPDINIPLKKKIIYSINNTFTNAIINFAILLLVQFLLGIIFFSARKNIVKAKNKKSHKSLQEIIAKSKIKNIVFYSIVMILMLIFFFTLSGFIGAYGGGTVDYFTAGIISLVFLEIFPFIWSLIIAMFRYFGIKNNNIFCFKISQFFMF